MIEHVFDPSRHRARHFIAEQLLPLQRSVRHQRGAQLRHDLGRVLRALAHGVVARIVGELGQAGLLAQRLPEMRRVGRQIQIAFARRMQAGDAARAHVAPDIERLALGPDHARGLHGQRASQQRHADELPLPAALALEQRGRTRPRPPAPRRSSRPSSRARSRARRRACPAARTCRSSPAAPGRSRPCPCSGPVSP